MTWPEAFALVSIVLAICVLFGFIVWRTTGNESDYQTWMRLDAENPTWKIESTEKES